MLAPNGKPTNLTERQWLQVRTKNFKEWFGDWEKFNIFANEFKNNKHEGRQLLYQRFSQEELRNGDRITEEAESLLQRGKNCSNPELQKEKTGNKERGLAQEKELEDWAKLNNLWIENTTESLKKLYGNPIAIEGESEVYDDNNKVVKAISLNYYIEPQLALDRIILHNYISDAKLTVKGFGRNSEGDFVIIAEQPFIKGEQVTQSEIVSFMKSLGFTPYNKRNTEFSNGEILINDLHDENIIKMPDGGFAIIDADFRLNTANYGLNGKRTTTKDSYEKRFHDLKSSVSKVVDENGEPLVVYRGDTANKSIFESKPASYNVTGIYITGNKKLAENYSKPSRYNNNTQGIIYELFVNSKNPYIGTNRDIDNWNKGNLNDYDSWIYGDYINGNGELVVRNPNQVKSATDNTGEFSKVNDEIYNYEDTKSIVSSMSDTQLQEEKSLIQQEEADYNILNNIEQFAINNDSPKTINIWSTEKNGYQDLSNIAERPFTLQLFDNEAPIRFNSVEQAFQYTKFRLLSKYLGFDTISGKFLLSNQKLTGEDYKDNVSSYVTPGTKAAVLKQGISASGVIGKIDGNYSEELNYINKHIEKILNASNGYDAKNLEVKMEDI